MKQFEGKTAVVTGAASGIGRALAERFAQARMQVVLADIEKDALDRAVQELEQRQYRVIGVVANTMVRESVEALAKRAIEEFGKVHVVCNNAGIAAMASGMKPIWEVSDRDWQWVMGVNFYGVLYGIQAFVPHMLAHGEEGHIVNTASLAGLMPGGGTYGVSKHGVLSLTETLHQNLTMQGAKIGASVLCPGFVNTNIFDAERNRPKDLARDAGARPSREWRRSVATCSPPANSPPKSPTSCSGPSNRTISTSCLTRHGIPSCAEESTRCCRAKRR